MILGKYHQKKHIHSATGKNIQTEVYAYTYDHAGRLLKTTHRLNEGATVTLAENTYDELGRLKTNRKGENTDLNTTYAYNIRSWTSDITNAHFIERLAYTYNGNISSKRWAQAGQWKTYDFAYDNLSRLKSANYTGDGNFNTTYSYDKHGNMTTLQRYGLTDATTYGVIDSLKYRYRGNQLKNISDDARRVYIVTSTDFDEKITSATDTTAVEYEFNANGAMTKDDNKKIRITYNSLNLPSTITTNSLLIKGYNEYFYNWAGIKYKVVQHVQKEGGPSPIITYSLGGVLNPNPIVTYTTKSTDYAGNKIYEDGILKRILVDGGYYESGKYYFYINDHLGNNRIVADAAASVVQSTQYYPFGMSFAGGSAAEHNIQPYKYNGKELDRRNDVNLYDYSARHYDPTVARFTTVDPLAEKYYNINPYAYCGNNPIKFIDPTGMSYTYNWDNNRYEDENGNEVEWQTVHDYIQDNKDGDPSKKDDNK
ncbi:MAG: RHS repeat-associated core domain-containing protein, partial [Prevotella sp.]|nr:RHS repeat-associated core domain-containing protein [Prevotella sp.]